MLLLLAKSSAGKLTQIYVYADATLGHVKRELAGRFFPERGQNMGLEGIRVLVGGRELSPDNARLFELGVESQQLLHVEADDVRADDVRGGPPETLDAISSPHATSSSAGEGAFTLSASAQELGDMKSMFDTEVKRLTAMMNGIERAVEDRLRIEIARLLAGISLERLSRVEDAVKRVEDAVKLCTERGERHAALATENSDMFKAKLTALETKTATSSQPSAAPALSPEIADRLGKLEEKLAASAKPATTSPPSAAPALSPEIANRLGKLEEKLAASAASVEVLQAQVLELESKGSMPSSQNVQALTPTEASYSSSMYSLASTLPSSAEATAGSAGEVGTLVHTKLAALEASVKTLEEKVKLQAKRAEQMMKEQRQRAVAQGNSKCVARRVKRRIC